MRDLTIHDQTAIAKTTTACQPPIAQTIIAQCTPQGSGAIALIRISGNQALEIGARISVLASKQTLISVPTHTIHYGFIVGDSEKIDNVLFLVMRGPKTFTGEDTVEITCHNNPFIIERIIELAIAAGARHAQNGEFTRRAVLNNKIDIVQAESINELIHANTQVSLKQAMAQVNGSFSHWVAGLEKSILKALAFCEASFEFLDEELEFNEQIKTMIQETLNTIQQVKLTFDKQQHIRQGIRIALIGSVNVGKSSLFNALLHQKRAIVTNIAGTTRDAIEAGLYKSGNYWTLVDTAGLRETGDVIEQEGIMRSFEQAQLADIIVLVFDSSRELTPSEAYVYSQILRDYHNKIICVHNKADLPVHENFNINLNFGNNINLESKKTLETLAISTHTNTGISALEHALENRIQAIFAAVQSPFLLNKRHHQILLSLEKDLTHVLSFFDQEIYSSAPYELIACHLNDALAHLSDLTGKTVSEQAMDAIFREFCVGK